MSGMCNLSEGLWNRAYKEGYEVGYKEGYEIGYKEGVEIQRTKNLEAIMENLQLTFEKAASILKIPQSEWEKYRAKLSI
jgi:flagellar biosynthesis/type III secretory pathway protein FliH